jgi:MtrB/PioB family decaheme-associated outer membrane protein
MNKTFKTHVIAVLLALLVLPLNSWAQDKDDDEDKKSDKKKSVDSSAMRNEATLGVYYLDHDAFRYGKYSGLTDKGFYLIADFNLEKRPDPESADTVWWSVQGWRLGLESRRLTFDYNDQGTQRFGFDYREIPNNRFDDGQIPYRADGPGTWRLAPGWEVAPGSSNTRGFETLQESLVSLTVDTKRRRFDLSYDRKFGSAWNFNVDYKHETKKGSRTLGSIFGSSGGNARAVILPAPVDWTTDIIEAMFVYGTARMQFGFGILASFFSNDQDTLVFQNAYGNQSGWADSVEFPGAYGRFALEPDNSYIQFRANAGFNFSRATRLTADVSFGQMEQDDRLLPWSINDELFVEYPVPLSSLDAKVDTTMVNLRLTSQLARRLGLRVNYHYDERDNKTPREVYPYIPADSDDQPDLDEGRINLPYSYKKQKADAILTYRFTGAARLKGGVEYMDYDRDYQEVSNSDELAWLLGVSFRGWSKASLTFDYRNSDRDVSEYIANAPYIQSHIPGTVGPDDYENHPLLRKYFLTDREREEFRGRLDFFPNPEINIGLAAAMFEDDYGDGYFGLNEAEVQMWTVDAGWYPQDHIALTGFYTNEQYEANQWARSFRNTTTADDPDNDWWADTTDDVDTYNIALTFRDIGADRGWNGVEFGVDFTYSNVNSEIEVTAADFDTAPLPDLVTRMKTYSFWGSVDTGEHSSLRLSAERARLYTADWGLDDVYPDIMANVLVLGESAANYDVWLLSASWSYRF